MPVKHAELVTEEKRTVFMETKTGSVILIRDVSEVTVDKKSEMIKVNIIRPFSSAHYSFPLNEIKWFEVKTSQFVTIR